MRDSTISSGFFSRLDQALAKTVAFLEAFPNRLAAASERILLTIESMTNFVVRVLRIATEKIARFLRGLLVSALKTAWYLLMILIFVLVPCFLASFGHELTIRASGWFVWSIGLALLAGGFLGGLLVLSAFLASVGHRDLTQSTDTSRKRRFAKVAWALTLLFFDGLSVAIIVGVSQFDSTFLFKSPLLHFLQRVVNKISTYVFF